MCFEEIEDISMYNFIHTESELCEKCFQSLRARFINFYVGDVKVLAVYNYDDTIKNLIYKFKGCYDYELKNVFLERYLLYLRIIYAGYVIVPVPSSKVDDEKRGFNHVEEIFKTLKLPMLCVLKKEVKEKQSSKSQKSRTKIDKQIIIENKEKLNGKKVLVVDDVYTTGATLYKAISLVKSASPKKVHALVIAKTIDLDKRNKKTIFPKLY